LSSWEGPEIRAVAVAGCAVDMFVKLNGNAKFVRLPVIPVNAELMAKALAALTGAGDPSS
jgi:hypothetical protein